MIFLEIMLAGELMYSVNIVETGQRARATSATER